MKSVTTRNMAFAAVFLALGLILPFFTGQIPQIGRMLLPMHIPILLCGIVCGWQYGLVIGFILPFLRFMMFGMPPIFPVGTAMAFELAIYGLVIGLIYEKLPKRISNIYISLGVSMIAGRIVWGVSMLILMGMSNKAFTWPLFMSGAFLNAVPGIILQFALIPTIVIALQKTKVLKQNETEINKGTADTTNH